MAHWDSEKISPDGFNRDGMTSALSSTHFSVALTKPQIGIGVPALSVSRLFHKLCKKWGHGWHLEQGVYFSSSFLHIYALLGVASNCRHKCYGSEAFRALPLQSMETRACFPVQCKSKSLHHTSQSPIMTSHALPTLPLLQKLIHIQNVGKNPQAIL
jgi:hypothetical protein